jgi:hypothetical protein
VISATVTPTATFTPTMTTTAEASLTLPDRAMAAPVVCASTPPPLKESGSYAQLCPGPSHQVARHNTRFWGTTGPLALVACACFPQPSVCEATALTFSHG